MFRPWEDNIAKPDNGEGNMSKTVKNKFYMEKACEHREDNVNIKNKDDVCLKYKHADFNDILAYLKYKIYPLDIKHKNAKSNFRKQCKPFIIEKGALVYKKTRAQVVFDQKEKIKIIKMIHCGSDTSVEASALSAHRGRDTTQRLIKKRYFWLRMIEDVRTYIQGCEVCQKVNLASLKVAPELKPAKVPKQVFRQIGVDLMSLPEVDGYKYVVVAIDYFSKWSEARPLQNKTAVSVARFIYDDIICRHGCPKIQISDQGREFLNILNNELYRLTGTRQTVTSAYNPQTNGLVERQNRTIKNCILKVLQSNVQKWPSILQGVLFAHRTAQHFSTGYSPFYILYQRDAILPVDVAQIDRSPMSDGELECNIETKINDSDVFNQSSFSKTLNNMINLRNVMEDQANKNIEEAQKRQRYSYGRRYRTGHVFKENDKVLVRNLKGDDRNGGWKNIPWKGPFIIDSINSENTCTLRSGKITLKKKQHLCNLKLFKERHEIADNYKDKLEVEDNDIGELEFEDNKKQINDNVCTNIKTLKEYRIFNPVSESWQMIKCKQLKLKLTEKLKFEGKMKILGEPTTIKSNIGDGNCLYRGISYWITGNEDNHLTIRKLVSEVVKNNENIRKYVGGEENLKIYLQKNMIDENGTWGTDVEIFAAAVLLQTSIYVYSTQRHTWQLFNKRIGIHKPIHKAEKCIYLINRSNIHFDVVTSV